MSKEYFVGIDIGSISVDVVLIDQKNNISAAYYERAYGKPRQKLISILKDLSTKFDLDNIKAFGFTGSGARRVAEILNSNFFNEILSHVKAIQQLYPQVRSIIDIGGEDSKLILLDKDRKSGKLYIKEFSMNTICAAGTGSFLDQQAKRLGVSIEKEFGESALKSKHPPRIAGRCSVFAKTDMIHLQQEACPDYDIIAGLCFALARNFKSNIAKGRDFTKPVSFQGGVAANKGMVRAFQEVLNLSNDELIVPTYYGCMGAIGCAILAKDAGRKGRKFLNLKVLEEKIQFLKGDLNRYERLTPKEKAKSIFDFEFNEAQITQDKGLLGIDVGSISTNVVIIDEQGKLLAKQYIMTEGRPLEAVKKGLQGVYQQVKDKVKIVGVGTTGSGRYLIGDFVGADVVKNEITTQAMASVFINPAVDTIFEIGGQDSKYISLDNGVVVDFNMNKVCAAGTGSFLEEQAERLNINIQNEFAREAFKANNPCALGDRCTVFMESDLMRFHQQGAELDDLIAGLSYSIAYNYLKLVVENGKIGSCIFFQGGVAFNKAVVAAFEKILGKEIIVPPHHEVTGAIGVALLAKKEKLGKSSFKGFKKIIESCYKLSSFECQDCPNRCELKKIGLESGESLYYGSRCEKYNIRQKQEETNSLPDLFKEYKGFLLRDFERYNRIAKGPKRERVGIPRCMSFYELSPLWSAFFGELGFRVVLSDETNKEIIDQSLQLVGSEPCFPIKVAHGHVKNLLKKGVEYIFLPTVINMPTESQNTGQSFNCPYVQSLPYLLSSVLNFEKYGVKLLKPEIILGWDEKIRLKSLINFAKSLGCKQKLARKAAYKAIQTQDAFYERIRQRGEEILDNLNGQKAAVIVSRPYNGYDKGINLNLPSKLRKLGILPMPLDYLPLRNFSLPEGFCDMYWHCGQKILAAAKFISKDKRLIPIYLSNFGCGPDSFINKFFTSITKGKPSLHLEIDEHSADVGIITRCEAFLDSIKGKSEEVRFTPPYLNFNHNKISKDAKIYIPRMGDYAFIAEAALRANGFKAEVFPESNAQTLYWGRKFTSGRECYPCILTTGDMVRIAKDPSFNPELSAFLMPSTEGPCRFGQYKNFHRMVLNELGLEKVPIVSFNQGKNLKDEIALLNPKIFSQLFQGLIAMDLLYKLLHSFRPYELKEGQTEKVYKECLDLLCRSVLNQSSILNTLKSIKEKFMQIETKNRFSKPLIGVVGEIFVRHHSFSNENIVKNIERFGGEVWLASIGEWIFHVNRTQALISRLNRRYFEYFRILFTERLLKRWEDKFFHQLNSLLDTRKEPDIKQIWSNCDSYLPPWFGEAALSTGKVIDFYERGIAGIVSVMPFTCLPGNIFTSVLCRLRRDCEDLPALVLSFDGSGQSNISTKLEALMYQASQRWSRLNIEEGMKKAHRGSV